MNQAVLCQSCGTNPREFTILICDHVICGDCLWDDKQTGMDGVSNIYCLCGICTYFGSPSHDQPSKFGKSWVRGNSNSTKLTISESLLRSPRQKKRQQEGMYRLGSPNMGNRKSRGLKTETVLIEESRILDGSKKSKGFHLEWVGDGLSRELTNEMKFLEIQFNKAMEQARKNFGKVLDSITDSYQNLVRNMKYFCLQQMAEPSQPDFHHISRIIQQKYDKTIGHKLKLLNEGFFIRLSAHRIEKQQPFFQASGDKLFREQQENSCLMSPNCRYNLQKAKLMTYIQELKEDRKGLKKMPRKPKHHLF